ncbi:metallophosphoesterase family protein [soil metagenome]
MTSPLHMFDAPLSIGVIGDTHLWRQSKRRLPVEILQFFSSCHVDLIVHTGDVNDRSVLDDLRTLSPVLAVRGNNDDPELQMALPERLRVQVGELKLGVVHGHGGRSAKSVALTAFDDGVDLVMFGHSHSPLIESDGTTVYFNPGSATERRWAPHCGIGIVLCGGDRIEPHLVLYLNARDLANVAPILAGDSSVFPLQPPNRH